MTFSIWSFRSLATINKLSPIESIFGSLLTSSFIRCALVCALTKLSRAEAATQDTYTPVPWITIARAPPGPRTEPYTQLSCDMLCVHSDPDEGERAALSTRRERLPGTASIAPAFTLGPMAKDQSAAVVTVHVERAHSACRVAVESAE